MIMPLDVLGKHLMEMLRHNKTETAVSRIAHFGTVQGISFLCKTEFLQYRFGARVNFGEASCHEGPAGRGIAEQLLFYAFVARSDESINSKFIDYHKDSSLDYQIKIY